MASIYIRRDNLDKLIKKIKKGDKLAFLELFKLIEKKMNSIARARLYNPEDVKDAIQDTILQIYLNISSLRNIKKFNSWSTSILINSCNAILRKKSKDNCLSYEYLDYEQIDEVSNEYIYIDDRIDFFSIIENLNIEERTIITMYYSSEYTTREISNILNMNENTVRSKLNRSKIKIKEDLNEGKIR